MALFDDLLSIPTTVLGAVTGQNQKQKAQDALINQSPSGSIIQNDVSAAAKQASAQGLAQGQSMFGNQGDLSGVSQDVLKQKQALSGGLTGQEMDAARTTAKNQINTGTQQNLQALQSIQGRQGIKGGAAAAQELGVLKSGQQAQQSFENNLLQQNYQAQTQGVNNLASDVNARLYGIQASQTGAVNQALAQQSLEKGLQISALPTPQPVPGALGQVTSQLSVICTEMRRQNLLDAETQRADCIFGLLTINTAPHVYLGYVVWAKHVAKLMRKSKLFTKAISIVALPWAHHMAFVLGYKPSDNKFGKFVHEAGYPLCGILGKLIMKLRGLNGNKYC